MMNIVRFTAGLALAIAVAGPSSAGSFQDKMGQCLTKHANARDPAMVTLECTAGGGKLTECKVVDNSATGKGFDKAALCVADAMPIGTKTGSVKVPMRFPGGG